MRQIKFRGKRLKDGKWIYGSLADYSMRILNTSVKKKIIFDNIASFATDNFGFVVNDHEVDPETIGQFTGLIDRNGKEIYEGDIIRYSDSLGLSFISPVAFYEGRFGIRMKYTSAHATLDRKGNYNDGHCHVDYTIEYEVVGNIYDNPELMETNIYERG